MGMREALSGNSGGYLKNLNALSGSRSSLSKMQIYFLMIDLYNVTLYLSNLTLLIHSFQISVELHNGKLIGRDR
jgi:hypothetical protein